LKQGANTLCPYSPGEYITVTRMAGGALDSCSIQFNGRTVQLGPQAQDLSDALGLPVMLDRDSSLDVVLVDDVPASVVALYTQQ
jgi:hypothetical protein